MFFINIICLILFFYMRIQLVRYTINLHIILGNLLKCESSVLTTVT